MSLLFVFYNKLCLVTTKNTILSKHNFPSLFSNKCNIKHAFKVIEKKKRKRRYNTKVNRFRKKPIDNRVISIVFFCIEKEMKRKKMAIESAKDKCE